jgi:membrane protease YdiL (CAAX protease family)
MEPIHQPTDDDSVATTQKPERILWPALVCAMCFPTVMAWIYFVVLPAPGRGADTGSFVALAAYGASKVIQFGFPLLWVIGVEKSRPRIIPPKRRDLRLGTTVGLLTLALLLVIYYTALRSGAILAATPAKVLAQMQSFHVATPFTYALMTVFISGAHSLMEEYYWRWFVFRELTRLVQPAAAVIVSSLAFMAHHVIILGVYFPGKFWTAALPFALCVAVAGAVWAWLYQRTNTLYASWISHLFADIAIMVAGYDMIFIQQAG